MDWIRAEHGLIKEDILEYLENLIVEERKLEHQLVVYVGTDAQRKGRGHSHKFVSMIALVSEGKGGKLMYSIFTEKRKIGLNEKLLTGVQKSIEVAYLINPLLEKYNIKMQIHVDINSNPKWASHKSMAQALGYIVGMGYDYRFKPNALCASFCADRYAKK